MSDSQPVRRYQTATGDLLLGDPESGAYVISDTVIDVEWVR